MTGYSQITYQNPAYSNPFHATGLFLYPENIRKSDVFCFQGGIVRDQPHEIE